MAKRFLSFDMDESNLIRAGAGDATVFDAWTDLSADDVLRVDLAKRQNHDKREERMEETFRQHGFPLVLCGFMDNEQSFKIRSFV